MPTVQIGKGLDAGVIIRRAMHKTQPLTRARKI